MVKFVVKMTEVFRDKIVVNGWQGLKSLLLKMGIYFNSEVKIRALKFIEIRNVLHFKSNIHKTFKQGFVKLKGLFSVKTSAFVSVFKFILSMPSNLTLKTTFRAIAYKKFAALFGGDIAVVSNMKGILYSLIYPHRKIGIDAVNKIFKQGFIKVKRDIYIAAVILTYSIKHIVLMKSNAGIKGAVKATGYKIFASLMGSKIKIVSDITIKLYRLVYPSTRIGIGFGINDLTSQKFIKVVDGETKKTFMTGGIVKISSNAPFYLKHLDPIKLKDMDIYTLKEIDGVDI